MMREKMAIEVAIPIVAWLVICTAPGVVLSTKISSLTVTECLIFDRTMTKSCVTILVTVENRFHADSDIQPLVSVL